MMQQYSNKIILKSLFYAPILVQLLLAILFMVMNEAFDFNSIITVVGISLIIYLIYCILIIPITYAISILLARKNWLNLITIVLGSMLMWLIVTVIGYLIFTQSLPDPLWKLFSDWYFYFIAIIAGFTYWVILRWLVKGENIVNN